MTQIRQSSFSSDGEKLRSSFRDPAGFLFYSKGVLLRQVNTAYVETFEELKKTGFLDRLMAAKLLVSHEEVRTADFFSKDGVLVLRPEKIPYISYPYEWCFSQLKQAALLTLELQRLALESGFVLKDASAYNVQFTGAQPIFIDTLSFDRYHAGKPWAAYRQFCEHFLLPLSLLSYGCLTDLRTLQYNLDGLPLEHWEPLLPWYSKLKFGVLTHLHIHRKFKAKETIQVSQNLKQHVKGVSKIGLLSLVDSLKATIESMQLRKIKTTWDGYYADTNYTSAGLEHKRELIAGFVRQIAPGLVFDLGANQGEFSRICSSYGAYVVSADSDFNCVEQNYRLAQNKKSDNLLPILIDLTNPSPGLGWNGCERESFLKRGPADLTLALALIHHLTIGAGASFEEVVDLCAALSVNLLIEFVPKSDSQVKRLLLVKPDIYDWYTEQNFIERFVTRFEVLKVESIKDSERKLYLMRRRS